MTRYWQCFTAGSPARQFGDDLPISFAEAIALQLPLADPSPVQRFKRLRLAVGRQRSYVATVKGVQRDLEMGESVVDHGRSAGPLPPRSPALHAARAASSRAGFRALRACRRGTPTDRPSSPSSGRCAISRRSALIADEAGGHIVMRRRRAFAGAPDAPLGCRRQRRYSSVRSGQTAQCGFWGRQTFWPSSISA